jgi:hypothetical protein
MFVTVSARNNAGAVGTWCPDNNDNVTAKQAQTFYSYFILTGVAVLLGQHWVVKNGFQIGKIDAVFP